MAKLHILANGTLLKASQIALNFSGGGVVVSLDPGDPDQVNVVIAGGGAAGSVDVAVPAEPAVLVGDAVYVTALGTVQQANASGIATTPAIGVVIGLAAGIATVRVCGQLGFGYAVPAGDTLWLATAPGGVSGAPPVNPGEVIQRIGISLGLADTLVLPDMDVVVL